MSRPRGLRYSRDRFRIPRFPEPSYPERSDPFDGGAWETYGEDPRPLTLDDLRKPEMWIGGGLLLALVMVALIVVLSSGPMPAGGPTPT